MNLYLSKSKLIANISYYGKQTAQHRQVARRLHTLLPERFNRIKRHYLEKRYRSTKAQRLTYLDKRYQGFLNEYHQVTSLAHENRILWETYRMLYQARQSLTAYYRK